MTGYLLGGAGIVALLAGGAAVVQTKRLEAVQANAVLIEAQLHTCGGRLDAILRDVRSDNEIDNLDLTDFDIPDGWLRGGSPASP